MSGEPEPRPQSGGEAPAERPGEGAPTATQGNERSGTGHLMERVASTPNLQAALKRVETNRGSPGCDGMKWDELRLWLRAHWKELCQQLLSGTYQPMAVRRVEIEKRGGGLRTLGIPSVLDRFIQQACLQILQPIFDPTFSEHSHGFRPDRRAQDAIREAQGYVQEGRHWVVDVDLEKFFDRVNHDVLMGRLAKRIEDKRMLRLIRRYLEAGMMADGVVVERHEGTPQGGPLSPLLANVLLDEVDRELERTGHRFVRYADDCNVYVRSKKAGERVMARLAKLYGKLRLRINTEKSAVAPDWERQFLGLAFWVGPGKHFVAYYIRGGELLNYVGVVEDEHWRTESWTSPADHSELREHFTDWYEGVQALVAATMHQQCFRWALLVRDPAAEALPDRILSRPVRPGHRLVDDDFVLRVGG